MRERCAVSLLEVSHRSLLRTLLATGRAPPAPRSVCREFSRCLPATGTAGTDGGELRPSPSGLLEAPATLPRSPRGPGLRQGTAPGSAVDPVRQLAHTPPSERQCAATWPRDDPALPRQLGEGQGWGQLRSGVPPIPTFPDKGGRGLPPPPCAGGTRGGGDGVIVPPHPRPFCQPFSPNFFRGKCNFFSSAVRTGTRKRPSHERGPALLRGNRAALNARGQYHVPGGSSHPLTLGDFGNLFRRSFFEKSAFPSCPPIPRPPSSTGPSIIGRFFHVFRRPFFAICAFPSGPFACLPHPRPFL